MYVKIDCEPPLLPPRAMYYKYGLAISTSMEGFLVPGRYFVTSGVANGAPSDLNAQDMALREAGIADCNLVGVSSIIPSGAEEIGPVPIPKGAVTFCVLARMTGEEGDRVGAGLAWSWGRTQGGERYGIVAEHHGTGLPSEIESIVRADLLGMAETRRMVLEDIHTKVESLICRDGYGCAVAVLVYVP
jgi:arginine decarboxylase